MGSPGTIPVFTPPPCSSLPVASSRHHFPVRRIYCVGRNYLEHIREMGADARDPPFFFQKPADAVVHDGELVPYPSCTGDLQHEVELVLAIGRAGSSIPVSHALNYVFGYAVGIDLTRRDLQVAARKSGRPWEAGKSFDHSAPCAALVPVEHTPMPADELIELSVNGKPRQSARLSQMIWSPAEVISQLSLHYHLHPGDLVFTGTPAGVGPLWPGDHVTARLGERSTLAICIGNARA